MRWCDRSMADRSWAIAALGVAPLLWADPAGAETTIEVEAGYAGSFVPGQEVPVRVRVGLHISISTVKAHLAGLMRKLDAHNRVEIATARS